LNPSAISPNRVYSSANWSGEETVGAVPSSGAMAE
jgi:hypothetical protein